MCTVPARMGHSLSNMDVVPQASAVEGHSVCRRLQNTKDHRSQVYSTGLGRSALVQPIYDYPAKMQRFLKEHALLLPTKNRQQV